MKEPWQMTFDEFARDSFRRSGAPGEFPENDPDPFGWISYAHQRAIDSAKTRGEIIPEAVLKSLRTPLMGK